jgi:isoleucyl-tRNA synthetase
LSHKEVGLGYETVEDPSLYYKAKLVDEDAFLLVWTTMPFTVVTDEMVGVKPDAEYSYVNANAETWIVAKDRIDDIMKMLRMDDYRTVKTVKGADLEGKRYIHPLAKKHISALAKLADDGKIHFVVAEEWVDITTGTGLVHLSPANGEEDYQVALRKNIPIFCPIDDQAKFTKEAGNFAGLFVRDADSKVAEMLEEEGMVLKYSTIKHEYPLCWRSQHKLVWLARREYFYWVDRLGDLAVEAAQKVEYFYEPPKNRFIEIIKEKVPWCISRERIWGTPLPVWVCTRCGEKNAVFSRKEIIAKAAELPDGENFELHRPWIDRVILKCERCGGNQKREPFVLDTWHNSGAAPYASFTDKEYEQLVPAFFLTEGIDQTRGWAYTLLIENVILTGRPEAPYKAFLFQGHVLDEKGNKMSKSLGNVIEGIPTLSDNSVDIVRFYMMWKASPLDGLSFSHSEMKTRAFQIISTLYHLHKYFQQNSKYDGFDAEKHTLEWAEKRKLFKPSEYYLLSKLEQMKDSTSGGYQRCRFQESAAAIDAFVIGTLSQSYLPMIRGELWDDREETLERRLAIYAVLGHVLIQVDILAHPISPYITEALYLQVFSTKSILLAAWPSMKQELRDEKLEETFAAIDMIISVTNAARMKAKAKRRWPMKSATVLMPASIKATISEHIELLKEMTNVKHIELTDSVENTPIRLKLKPRWDLLGPIFKAALGKARKHFEMLEPIQVKKELDSKELFVISIDSQEFKLSRKEIEFEFIADDKHAVVEREGYAVALLLERDTELVAEGVMRDIARRLQSLRKERGYRPTDILDAAYLSNLDADLADIVAKKKGELTFLVRVKKIETVDESTKGIKWSEAELDGKAFKMSVQ